jgi:hypothetical protein
VRHFTASRNKVPVSRKRRSRTVSARPQKAQRDRLLVRLEKRDWSKFSAVVSSLTAIVAIIFTALSLQATREQIPWRPKGR